MATFLYVARFLSVDIWKSSISVSTEVRLYKVYILPVLLYC